MSGVDVSWDKSAPDISSGSLSEFDSNSDVQVVEAVHGTPVPNDALCNSELTANRVGEPTGDPCAENQFFNSVVNPVVGPQPEDWGCPNCGLTTGNSTLWLGDPSGFNLSSPVMRIRSGSTVRNYSLGKRLRGNRYRFSMSALNGMSIDSARLVGVRPGGTSRSSPLFIGN